jgi:hypothetical protein
MRVRGLWTKAGVKVAVVVAAFAVGIAAWAVLGAGDGRSDGPDQTVEHNDPNAFTVPATVPGQAEVDLPPAVPTDGGAATPIEAVEGYLAAEAGGRYDESFLFLTTADRELYRSAANWTQQHADLPPIVGYMVSPTSAPPAPDGRVTVGATLALEPSLDEVAGLVAARATAAWVAVQEGGLWRVLLSESALTPTWPSDTTAGDAVRAWAEARRDCPTGTQITAEWAGGLLGFPSLADDLCEASSRVRVGPPVPLDPIDAATFVAAFGEEVAEVARVVPLTSPAELQAVVAPLGDNWLVIGVLPPPP